MKEYKVDFKSHFRHLWLFMCLIIVIPLGLHYLMMYRLGEYSFETAMGVGLFVFFIYVFPMILIHINYSLYSSGAVFLYDESNGAMSYEIGKVKISFVLEDVESIICYKSWPLAEGRAPIFSWDNYNYAVICLKNGDSFKISSLLIYEFDKHIKYSDVKIKKTFYPWISPDKRSTK